MKPVLALIGFTTVSLFGESPVQVAMQQNAVLNHLSGGPNLLLQAEGNYCIRESWGETNASEPMKWRIPGMSDDILHQFRDLLADKPKASVHVVIRGSGLTKVAAVIWTLRLPNLRSDKVYVVKTH